MSAGRMKRKRTTRNSLKTSFSLQQQAEQNEAAAVAAALYLPDDCWKSICTFLVDGDENNIIYLEPFSLTSKRFLSITNGFRSSLTISYPTIPFVPALFCRFPNLTSLHITTNFHLRTIVRQISKFSINLKLLKFSNQWKFPTKQLLALSKKITTLTSLTYSNWRAPRNNHFIFISDCFPLLEELDLQNHTVCFHHIGDGVKAMLSALPKLRKINLSSYYYIDDLLLLHLCKNCKFLEEIVMFTCPLLTSYGIAAAIHQRPTLRSLSFRWKEDPIHGINISHFIDSLVSLKSLTCLDLSYAPISDELFSSIGIEDLPWRRLVLQHCTGHTYAGIFSLLSKRQRIQHLDLKGADFLNDNHVVELSSFLTDLVSINLSKCGDLTDSTLFALVRSCPSLSDIKMEHTRIGENIAENSNSLTNFFLYPQLKSLYLAHCSSLKDESIMMFASSFPNLQLLDLSSSNNNYIFKGGSICQVLRRCCNIRHLKLDFCFVANELRGINFEVPKLEVLNLSYTYVDDETLYVISKNCCGLLQLVLEFCIVVTNKGVKHVVKNCTKLREINLRSCEKVCADIVDSMVNSRPSLRKIIAPPRYHISDEKRKLLWQRGCDVI